jgi:[NiFe] hydrogenase diaphorase moiety large subunit
MICQFGPEKFREIGKRDCADQRFFRYRVDTPKAGIHELELGMTVQQFVEEFGDGDTKAVLGWRCLWWLCFPGKTSRDTIIAMKDFPRVVP